MAIRRTYEMSEDDILAACKDYILKHENLPNSAKLEAFLLVEPADPNPPGPHGTKVSVTVRAK